MPVGEHQTFDLEALLDRLDGDLRLARELLTTFLEESPAMCVALRDAVNSRQASRVERAAHSLRGALAAVSAPAAVHLADRLETDSRNGDLSASRTLGAELEAELDLFDRTLRSYLREA